jgi:ubiquinone/menaquinone biosynthesis C-methylase UbiE
MAENSESTLKQIIGQLCPPIVLRGIRAVTNRFTPTPPIVVDASRIVSASKDVVKQDLDIYWDAEMAEVLETWGDKNVWKEIPLLMVNCQGKILDIACGTGKTMSILSKFWIDIHGCDISDLLISKAIERGIPPDHLTVCDATKMPYENNSFDYAYSIGSIEHFTEDGITQLLKECHRAVRKTSFHMIPVSRSGKDEGWLKTYQSFHNNSVSWWLEKYQSIYNVVHVLDSTWEDEISVGKWFVCVKSEK